MSSKEVKCNNQILQNRKVDGKKTKTILYLVNTKNITSTIIFDTQKFCEVLLSLLYGRRKLREVQQVAKGHTGSTFQNWDAELGLLDTKAYFHSSLLLCLHVEGSTPIFYVA